MHSTTLQAAWLSCDDLPNYGWNTWTICSEFESHLTLISAYRSKLNPTHSFALAFWLVTEFSKTKLFKDWMETCIKSWILHKQAWNYCIFCVKLVVFGFKIRFVMCLSQWCQLRNQFNFWEMMSFSRRSHDIDRQCQ